MVDTRVISIGALAAHPLWGETQPVRTGHATTTLIRADDRTILIDPGLPAAALEARLGERANLKPEQVSHVLLTSFHPDTWRAIERFDEATWWIGSVEREQVGVALAMQLRAAAEADDPRAIPVLERAVAVLQRCEPVPDVLADSITIFPLPGVTPGLTGVLVAATHHTLLIAGDAIATIEHLDQGKVLPTSADPQLATASFMEGVEIADLIVCGRDNLVVNPMRRPF